MTASTTGSRSAACTARVRTWRRDRASAPRLLRRRLDCPRELILAGNRFSDREAVTLADKISFRRKQIQTYSLYKKKDRSATPPEADRHPTLRFRRVRAAPFRILPIPRDEFLGVAGGCLHLFQPSITNQIRQQHHQLSSRLPPPPLLSHLLLFARIHTIYSRRHSALMPHSDFRPEGKYKGLDAVGARSKRAERSL